VEAEVPTAWSKVVGRRERRKETQGTEPPHAVKPLKGGIAANKKEPQQQQRQQQQQQQQKKAQKTAKRKVPKTEAVVITCPAGTYADVMSKARREIDPKALDIENIRVKRAITDGLIYEIAEENRAAKASALAAALKGTIPPGGSADHPSYEDG
jgi:predicted component of type VI protein secretion system